MTDKGIANLGTRLSEDQVHLFYCDVAASSLQTKHMFSRLNIEDCERFVSFKKESRKYQFGMARCLIKQVLFTHFNIPLTHKYEFYDFCEWVVLDSNLKFYVSISHSKNIVVVAISVLGRKIGVDVEFQKNRQFHELLDIFASENERQLFNQTTDGERFFYRLWTAKEAYIKAYQMTMSELSGIDLSANFSSSEPNSIALLYQSCIENDDYCLSVVSDVSSNVSIQKILL